jgi:hypothetical protein
LIVLNLSSLHPLGATRQNLFIYPFLLIPVGLATWQLVRSLVTFNRDAAAVVGLGGVILPIAMLYGRSTPAVAGYFGSEFIVTRHAVTSFQAALREVRTGDILLTNAQSANYLIFLSGRHPDFRDGLSTARWQGAKAYFTFDDWGGAQPSHLCNLMSRVEIPSRARVWFLILGWSNAANPYLALHRRAAEQSKLDASVVDGHNVVFALEANTATELLATSAPGMCASTT